MQRQEYQKALSYLRWRQLSYPDLKILYDKLDEQLKDQEMLLDILNSNNIDDANTSSNRLKY